MRDVRIQGGQIGINEKLVRSCRLQFAGVGEKRAGYRFRARGDFAGTTEHQLGDGAPWGGGWYVVCVGTRVAGQECPVYVWAEN